MSRLIHPIDEAGEVAIATDQTTLPFPPTEHGGVPTAWEHSGGLVGEIDLAIWAAASTNITAAEAWACMLRDGTIADDDVDTVDFTNDELDITGHGLCTGDGPIRLTTATTLPAGLALATDYWVIYVNANTIQLAASLADAWEQTAVAIGDAGTGTHTIHDTADTKLTHYHSLGLMGPAFDGAIALTARKAYTMRVSHSPRVAAYAVTATLSAAEATSASMYPVIDR